MIQDIAPHHFANEYRPSPPEKESFLLFYRGRDVLLTERDGKLDFPRFSELEGENSFLYERYTYLFSIDEDRFYLAPDNLRFDLLDGARLENREIFRTMSPRHLAFAGITGFQLYGLVPQPPLLRTLRTGDAAGPQGTDDALYLLRADGVP